MLYARARHCSGSSARLPAPLSPTSSMISYQVLLCPSLPSSFLFFSPLPVSSARLSSPLSPTPPPPHPPTHPRTLGQAMLCPSDLRCPTHAWWPVLGSTHLDGLFSLAVLPNADPRLLCLHPRAYASYLLHPCWLQAAHPQRDMRLHTVDGRQHHRRLDKLSCKLEAPAEL